MENKFSVHYQTWKNKKAVHKVLTDFRKYFPSNPIHLISDNGADYTDYSNEFNLKYTFKNNNVFPGGKFGKIEDCYEWLNRLNTTCKMFETEWVVLFEDDVITQGNKINFPQSDSGGFIVNEWRMELTKKLQEVNKNNVNWGYGMCGGSIFKRDAFLNAYKNIDKFPLDELSQLDTRIIGWSDTLINCFLQYFGYTYSVWNGMDDMSWPNRKISKNACFIHGYKELY